MRAGTAFRCLGTAAIPLALVLFVGARPSAAALQEAGQRRCIVKLNQAGVRLAKAQGAVDRACFAAFAAGRPGAVGSPGSAQLCLDADPFGKVARAEAKTLASEAKSCSDPLPEFGHTSGAEVNTVVRTQARNLAVELFGDLDAAIAAAGSSAEAARCQAAVLAAAVKVQDKTWAAALRAKKLALATATSAPELAQGLASTVGADPRLGALRSRLAARVAEACTGVALGGIVTVFGCGPDATSSPEALGACVAHSGSCATGFGLAPADGLLADLDLDLFDDGLANESCLAN